jgi:AcrR family transcriptional regulator
MPPTTRQALLLAAVDHVTEHGLGDLSLRRLATALGTSHRMLIYHFGSRQGLLVEIVREAEARQRTALADLRLEPGATPLEIGRRMWERLADPALWPLERLFFEVYVDAAMERLTALTLAALPAVAAPTGPGAGP